jgi:hypothetical protein
MFRHMHLKSMHGLPHFFHPFTLAFMLRRIVKLIDGFGVNCWDSIVSLYESKAFTWRNSLDQTSDRSILSE